MARGQKQREVGGIEGAPPFFAGPGIRRSIGPHRRAAGPTRQGRECPSPARAATAVWTRRCSMKAMLGAITVSFAMAGEAGEGDPDVFFFRREQFRSRKRRCSSKFQLSVRQLPVQEQLDPFLGTICHDAHSGRRQKTARAVGSTQQLVPAIHVHPWRLESIAFTWSSALKVLHRQVREKFEVPLEAAASPAGQPCQARSASAVGQHADGWSGEIGTRPSGICSWSSRSRARSTRFFCRVSGRPRNPRTPQWPWARLDVAPSPLGMNEPSACCRAMRALETGGDFHFGEERGN